MNLCFDVNNGEVQTFSMSSEMTNDINYHSNYGDKYSLKVNNTENTFFESVHIETSKDGEGFCAFSKKYPVFLGYGKTINDASDCFIEAFRDKKYGELNDRIKLYYEKYKKN